jgi:hypothetical protein
MNTHQLIPLRQQARKALQESTIMLQVAGNLLEQGNREEARRLQREARAKRDASMLLMAKANELEMASGPEERFRNHASDRSRPH